MVGIALDEDDLIGRQLRQRFCRRKRRIPTLDRNTDRFFNPTGCNLLPDGMFDALDLNCPADDLARVERLPESPFIRMKKSLAPVRRPPGGEFLFEHELYIL